MRSLLSCFDNDKESRDQNHEMDSLKFIAFLLTILTCHGLKKSPNIVFILTDDEDVEIGGTQPIVKSKKLIGEAGITFTNMYGTKAAGGVEHVPPGWDEWHGLVGNSKYYNYKLSVNGKEEVHGSKYPDDYLTDLIGRRATKFIEGLTYFSDPFFMMLSTPACHAPFTPAPQYNTSFKNVTAPRGGSFNHYDKNRHWLVRSAKHPLGKESMDLIDPVYRNRWRTLLSVDDLVENVINTLKDKKLLDNTYIFYASDNGYHLGQLSLPYDKRQLYEFDIKVPLMVRGPGITPNQTRQDLISNIDLAPTFIDLIHGKTPSTMDGQSFKELLLTNTTVAGWRTDFLVEHFGEVQETIKGCPTLNHQGVAQCFPDCVCEDSYNNTYTCVRTISKTQNLMYCEFVDSEDFVEVYDLTKDPNQLSNIAKTIDPKVLLAQNKRLVELSICQGPSCRKFTPYPPVNHKSSQLGPQETQANNVFRFESKSSSRPSNIRSNFVRL